jgi:hypothetical protein
MLHSWGTIFDTIPWKAKYREGLHCPLTTCFMAHRMIVLPAGIVYICSFLDPPTSFAIRSFQLLWEDPASIGSPRSRD